MPQASASSPSARDFEMPGRSVAMGRNGMAATSHPAATLTAIEVLRAGGNAIDAAIAACAVQCVVEPAMTGIGGDCFALYAPNGGPEIHAFNGAGRSPAGTDAEALRRQGHARIPPHIAAAVTIPGAVDAWCRLSADHGSMGLNELLQPAIAYARDGYAVTPRVAFDWRNAEPVLAARPATAEAYLRNGRAPAAGTVHRQPRLAETLAAIAEHGRDALYTGPVAAELVETLRAEGGSHSLADFAGHAGSYVTPIRAPFGDYEVVECPPPGQGIIVLLILGILARLPRSGGPLDPARLHLEIEAARQAYAVRDAALAEGSPASVEEFLAPRFLDKLAALIDTKVAATELHGYPGPEHRDTVYISVVDRHRNAASFINSIFWGFGSGILAPRSGVLLNNRGSGFSLVPGHRNSLAPGRQPLHTIIPAMLTRQGRVVMSFGVMGGHYQAMGQAALLSKVLEQGLDLQTAIDLPRLFPDPMTGKIEAEATLPAAMRAGLEALGHRFMAADDPIGGAQAIWIDHETGVLTGGSDPRKDGCALGY
jgi:gamma-glutamyltranspeptidase / glutathione hydrolase